MSATRVGLVGPGRLGTLVAHALSASGAAVTRVAGGSDASRSRLRSGLAGVRDVPLEQVAEDVDLLVLSTPDGAIAEVVDLLVRADALDASHRVIHLAGVHGTAPLRRAGLAGARVAALHPATTVPTGSRDPAVLHGVAWAVTASPVDRPWAHGIVTDLGGDPFDVPEDARVRYHAALALASNAVGAAVVAARRALVASGVTAPDRLIAPIAHASVDAAAIGGAAALTGPVVRGDMATVAAHLAALGEDLPEVADAYRALSRAILTTVRPALPGDLATALDALLADGPSAGSTGPTA